MAHGMNGVTWLTLRSKDSLNLSHITQHIEFSDGVSVFSNDLAITVPD